MAKFLEGLIPQLTRIMERVMAAHAAGLQAREALAAEEKRITMSGGGVAGRRTWTSGRWMPRASPVNTAPLDPSTNAM